MNFVFYNIETTGISPEYDQPLQFAAIRMDDNFVELERINIRCRLAPYIPSIWRNNAAFFYVGITRTKAEPDKGTHGTLILTYCQKMPAREALSVGITPAQVKYGKAQLIASQFISELGLPRHRHLSVGNNYYPF